MEMKKLTTHFGAPVSDNQNSLTASKVAHTVAGRTSAGNRRDEGALIMVMKATQGGAS